MTRARATLSFTMMLLVLASLISLVLTILGVYAVISYSTTQRRAEIGMRMALGANPHDVVIMIMRQCGPIIGGAIVLGVLAAVLSARLLQTFVFGVQPVDYPTYGVVAVGLFSLAMFACWLPARRASRLPPLEALKRV